ncbi:hypothetical protein BDV95DRAFT_603422 [Massariosphaeria phaeospora]|uniref:MIF4G-like type 1 domain-containing protein n=1 Tax=Massariosphaeria phaeospora TaxID=100035 RepID=A0A7C8MF07_9PLEO|nr:hypothetical protein BDV95DRAFT_603422 [Massariosphaeria phaeospora]
MTTTSLSTFAKRGTQFDKFRDVVGEYLVDLDCYWSLDTFAKRGTQFNKFRDATGDKVLWKSEHMQSSPNFSRSAMNTSEWNSTLSPLKWRR